MNDTIRTSVVVRGRMINLMSVAMRSGEAVTLKEYVENPANYPTDASRRRARRASRTNNNRPPADVPTNVNPVVLSPNRGNVQQSSTHLGETSINRRLRELPDVNELAATYGIDLLRTVKINEDPVYSVVQDGNFDFVIFRLNN